MGGGSASTSPILVGHTHPPAFVVGCAWHCQGTLAWQPALYCSQHKQFHLEPRNPRKPPLLEATKSFHSPGQTLHKYNEFIQLRKEAGAKETEHCRSMGTRIRTRNRSFTGLGAGHCTLLLLKSNKRCSVLIAVSTGDSY